MRTAATMLVLALAFGTALAGQSPYIRAFVTFDPDDYVFSDTTGAPGSIVNAYLCFDSVSVAGGLTGVSLVLDFLCGGFVAGSADVTVFHPNAQTVIGGPDNVAAGWVIAAPECVHPGPEGIICVAMVPWFYLGTPGDILILPNPVDGRATVDCNNDLDFFCVHSHGAIGQEVVTPGDPDCEAGLPTTHVYCEPQGGEYPTHPPTYWYKACPGYGEYMHGFHVQVLDPEIDNYTNWIDPYGWVHCDSITTVRGEIWVSWVDTTDPYVPDFGYTMFGFDNPNPSCWGHWTITMGGTGHTCDPYSGMSHSSWDFTNLPDGGGYRVHIPEAPVPVRAASWGAIKALYR